MISVTPEGWTRYKSQVREILQFLPTFFRNPIAKMKALPTWDWATVLTLHAAFGALVGAVKGLLTGKIILIFLNLFSSTISTLLIGFLGATFFYYFFLFVLNRKEDYLKFYIMVALASLPMLALRIFKFIGEPIDLIGFAILCLLCTVSLVEVYTLPRKMAVRIMGGIYALFFVIWAVEVIRSSRHTVDTRQHVTPESLDILQKELGKEE